jgi:hypothetical protein
LVGIVRLGTLAGAPDTSVAPSAFVVAIRLPAPNLNSTTSSSPWPSLESFLSSRHATSPCHACMLAHVLRKREVWAQSVGDHVSSHATYLKLAASRSLLPSEPSLETAKHSTFAFSGMQARIKLQPLPLRSRAILLPGAIRCRRDAQAQCLHTKASLCEKVPNRGLEMSTDEKEWFAKGGHLFPPRMEPEGARWLFAPDLRLPAHRAMRQPYRRNCTTASHSHPRIRTGIPTCSHGKGRADSDVSMGGSRQTSNVVPTLG